jgi:hypothetical protein
LSYFASADSPIDFHKILHAVAAVASTIGSHFVSAVMGARVTQQNSMALGS